MKNFDVIIFGGVTQDIMFYTKEAVLIKNKKDPLKQELIGFEYGAKIHSDKVKLTFGGGGGNTAVNLSLLGLKTAVVTSLGNDRIYDDYLKNFKNKKVDTTLIQKINTGGSGFSFIINYGNFNEHVIFSYRGANDLLKIPTEKLKTYNCPWYYLSGLSGQYQNYNLQAIFNLAKAKKIKLAWNPGFSELKKGYAGLKNYFKQVELLIVNYDEALELVQGAKIKTKEIKNLLKELFKFGPKYVTISHGHLGAYLYDGKKIYYEPALPIIGVNTTGAGDAFGSSLVGGLILFNYNLNKALKLAIIRSNYVIRKIGAQVGLLNKNESLKLLKNYGQKKSKT